MGKKGRTLVYVVFSEDYVSIRTVSRSRKSPHRFYIPRHGLEELEDRPEVISQDIHSFAIIRRDDCAGTIRIEFTWLNSNDGCAVSGYRDTIILPYDRFMECLHESSRKDELVMWKTLSIDDSIKQAKITFKSKKNLHAVLKNSIIRRKFIRFLREQFKWANTEQVEIYDDFTPYSFRFQETRDGEAGICGGLILHGQEDMETAYYSMHT